jgi:protein SCO1/2
MKYFISAIIFLTLLSCSNQEGPLPFLGQKINKGDTIVYHQIRPFDFIDQDSMKVSNQTLADNIYIADFFFTSCPSICPKVTKEMMKINEEFKSEPLIKLISFTLDPKRDTPAKLKQYAYNLDVNTDKWIFVHGDKGDTYELTQDFFVTAIEDEDAPGGVAHSGQIVLVDKQGHIRSFSDGTDPTTTSRLIQDIRTLINDYK